MNLLWYLQPASTQAMSTSTVNTQLHRSHVLHRRRAGELLERLGTASLPKKWDNSMLLQQKVSESIWDLL